MRYGKIGKHLWPYAILQKTEAINIIVINIFIVSVKVVIKISKTRYLKSILRRLLTQRMRLLNYLK